MELEEFIKTTLVNIRDGVHAANEILAEKYKSDDRTPFRVEPAGWGRDKGTDKGFISFDVAVTVAKESKGGGSGAIKVFVASLGGKKEKTDTESHVSRIKFYIAASHTLG